MASVGGEEPVKNIFILHRCNTGGTPFPLCPIGCSSNYPLGKRRLGEQPYYFSSSVITCRYILFIAQEFLRKVKTGAYKMLLLHGSSVSHFSPDRICVYSWLFPVFFILIEGFISFSWNCSFFDGKASDVLPWLNYFVLKDTRGGKFSHIESQRVPTNIHSHPQIQINNWLCHAHKILFHNKATSK